MVTATAMVVVDASLAVSPNAVSLNAASLVAANLNASPVANANAVLPRSIVSLLVDVEGAKLFASRAQSNHRRALSQKRILQALSSRNRQGDLAQAHKRFLMNV